MDRLEAMQTFVAVAELGGFARAARRLRLSPARVTRLVAFLEEHLRVELLHRTTRAVALTDAGARHLPRIREIVEAARALEHTSTVEQSTPAGRFAITAPVVFGRRHVAPLLARFLARHPAVRAELVLLDRVVDLVEEGFDLAVRIGALDDSSLKVRPVGATRRVLVASPAYLAAHGRPRRPADLAHHATIHMTPLEWRFVRGGRVVRVKLVPVLATNSAEVAVEHACNDGGITQVLAYQAIDAIRAGRLEVLLPRFEPRPSPIQLLYPGPRASTTTRAFIDFAAAAPWTFVDLRRATAAS